MLSCAPISSSTEIKITNPKLASNVLVKLAVCVKKPGPIAEVAIKNAAPTRGDCENFFLGGGIRGFN